MLDEERFEIFVQDDNSTIGRLQPNKHGFRTRALRSLLWDASSRLKKSLGGHLPDDIVVNFVQANYTSEQSICETFADTAHRLCLFDDSERLISTVLVSREPEAALVVDSSHINVSVAAAGLPPCWHQIFNFTTSFEYRRTGRGRKLLNWVLSNRRQLGLTGDGIWTYVEPPDRLLYIGLGFQHLSSADLYLHLPGTDNSEYNGRYLEGVATKPAHGPDFKLKCFLMTKTWTVVE
jgi:GNAT superfamily N-acetyltransferase